MSCGPGKGLEALTKAKDALNGFTDGLTAGADGIMGKLDDLAAGADAAIGDAAAKLKEMMPNIELPDMPDLPNLELPELPIPKMNLQLEVGGFLDLLSSNNPLDKAKALLNLDSLKDKFPSMPAAELDKLIADLKAGKIDKETLCKLVPNIEEAVDGIIEKGIPSTAPEEAAKDLPKPEEIIDPAKVQEAAAEITEELTAATEAIQADVTKITTDMLNKVNQIKAQSKFTFK
jgi:hypothetical protein|tara:strand:+ start:1360 stop:2055 length:696 start_codon:yes stop_codon:yes gene_type:complete